MDVHRHMCINTVPIYLINLRWKRGILYPLSEYYEQYVIYNPGVSQRCASKAVVFS